jgi:hypothetical protein
MSITSVRNRPVFPSLDAFSWPGDFARTPDEEWTRQPVDQFGLNYGDVGNHGWYKNLEPTIFQVLAMLESGGLLIDYSSGTGILTRRLVDSISYPVGIVNVDASPRFLQEYLFQPEEFLARISGSYGLGAAAEMARIGLAQPARAEEKV